eukprot:m.218897 g.218897  ORF g.218897 m.218897 type:complete len:147 (-) comp30127_c0_seq1:75-515(-)
MSSANGAAGSTAAAAGGGNGGGGHRNTVQDLLDAAAAADQAADDSDSDKETGDGQWLRPPPGGSRGIRVGEMYQAAIPSLSSATPRTLEGDGSAGARAVVESVPASSERKRKPDEDKTGVETETDTSAAAAHSGTAVEDKKHRPDR